MKFTTLVESYFPIRTEKKFTLATRKPTSIMLVSSDSNLEQYIPQFPVLKYGKVLSLYNDGDDGRASIKLMYHISYNNTQYCHYFKRDTCSYKLGFEALLGVLSCVIEIESVDGRNVSRVNLVWERY